MAIPPLAPRVPVYRNVVGPFKITNTQVTHTSDCPFSAAAASHSTYTSAEMVGEQGTHPVYIVDAFTERRFAGSQCAVCLINKVVVVQFSPLGEITIAHSLCLKELTSELCQKIAAEFNLPATAFPIPLGEKGSSVEDKSRLGKCRGVLLSRYASRLQPLASPSAGSRLRRSCRCAATQPWPLRTCFSTRWATAAGPSSSTLSQDHCR